MSMQSDLNQLERLPDNKSVEVITFYKQLPKFFNQSGNKIQHMLFCNLYALYGALNLTAYTACLV